MRLALLLVLLVFGATPPVLRVESRDALDPSIIDTWTLEQQVGQLLIWGSTNTPADLTAILESDGTSAPIPIGGVLLTSKKERTNASVRDLAAFLRTTGATPVPPFLCADQEGGKVAALRDGVRVMPSAAEVGQWTGEWPERKPAFEMAQDVHAAGIDMILGPVLDVDGPPLNPVIGGKERSYGEDPLMVGEIGASVALGFLYGGVVPVFKHFPGHGTATTDSHLVLPHVETSREDWEKGEQMPYVHAILQRLRFDPHCFPPRGEPSPIGVMVAHLDWPALTNGEGPTCYSRTLVTTELREGLGLQNDVIISDDLLMRAIADPVAGAIAMRRAGIDLLIVSRDRTVLRGIHAALVKAYTTGDLDRAELRASLERILRLKRYIRDHWVDVNEESRTLPMELPEGIL